MALMLAPYTDAMRLGMGFNSYTQTCCIGDAVDVPDGKRGVRTIRDGDISQVVSYSSRVVARLSEVVSSMNISYSSAIKKGTVEVGGDASAIDDEKIKQSDLNAVVQVKVTNQTTVLTEHAEFIPPKVDKSRPVATSKDFNDFYGDCYISGYIEGGDFTGIVSITILDQTNKSTIAQAIRRSLSQSAGGKKSSPNFRFYPSQGSETSNSTMTSESAFSNTEMTYTVSWMGGGQVKDPAVPWNLDTVMQAAAAFPKLVSQTPQKTYAILTPYKANRKFIEWMNTFQVSPLSYDNASDYTAELFDNYMEYKQLLKRLADILDNPAKYTKQDVELEGKKNAIGTDVGTLTAVKTAIRVEMNKIVAAVDCITKDPNVLERRMLVLRESKNDTVKAILASQLDTAATKPARKPAEKPIAESGASKDVSNETGEKPDRAASHGALPGDPKPDIVSQDVESASSLPKGAAENGDKRAKHIEEPAGDQDAEEFDFSTMISPAIWNDLMPQATSETKPVALPDPVQGGASNPATGDFPALRAPTKFASPPTAPQLNILAAMCGRSDVTDTLRQWVQPNNSLSFKASSIGGLLKGQPALPRNDIGIVLAFIYQYGSGEMRLFVARAETPLDAGALPHVYTITPATTPTVVVQPTTWNIDTWSTLAVVYGSKVYIDAASLDKVKAQIKSNYDGGRGSRSVAFNNSFFGDPWFGMVKTGYIFYQAQAEGPVQCASAIESISDAILSSRPSSASTGSEVFLRTFDARLGSDLPLMRFENGVEFIFDVQGDLVAQQAGQVRWRANVGSPQRKAVDVSLEWTKDNKLLFSGANEGVYFGIKPGRIAGNKSYAGYVVLSDHAPYLSMGYYEGALWHQTWSSDDPPPPSLDLFQKPDAMDYTTKDKLEKFASLSSELRLSELCGTSGLSDNIFFSPFGIIDMPPPKTIIMGQGGIDFHGFIVEFNDGQKHSVGTLPPDPFKFELARDDPIVAVEVDAVYRGDWHLNTAPIGFKFTTRSKKEFSSTGTDAGHIADRRAERHQQKFMQAPPGYSFRSFYGYYGERISAIGVVWALD